MKHNELQQLLSAYADGYANEQQRAVVLAHLETCSSCQHFLADIQQMREGIRETADVHLPHAFSAKIIASIQKNEEVEVPWMGVEPSARNTVFALAVIVMIMFATTLFGGKEPELGAQHLLTAGVNDSLANTVLMQQTELSKDDVLLALVTN
jgi:anti-sigma factor RsiW